MYRLILFLNATTLLIFFDNLLHSFGPLLMDILLTNSVEYNSIMRYLLSHSFNFALVCGEVVPNLCLCLCFCFNFVYLTENERSVFMVRFYGGTLLGLKRFTHIENVVKQALDLLTQKWTLSFVNSPSSVVKHGIFI